MNKKIFLIAILFVGTIISLTVKAEDLTNCTKTLDGECYNSLNKNVNITDYECNVMLDGQCIEHFNVTSNKPIPTEVQQDIHLINNKKQNRICDGRFGFEYIIDPYNKRWVPFVGLVYDKTRIYIIDIAPNSSAAKMGLQIGDEIVKINDNKVIDFKKSAFDSYLAGLQSIKLDLISVNNDKKSVILSRSEICTTYQTDPLFDSYWEQICAIDLDGTSKYLSYISRINNKLTPQFRLDYNSWQNELSVWLDKKYKFQKGFNLCLSNNYNRNEVSSCLNQLVNSSLNNIAHEQNIVQAKVQQQIQQNQINAINNYSDALRNQQVNVSGYVDVGVQHSGTVDVNHNINGTMYHYNRW